MPVYRYTGLQEKTGVQIMTKSKDGKKVGVIREVTKKRKPI
jgi:hypothetical protein